MEEFVRSILQSRNRMALPFMTHPGIEEIGKRVVDAVTDGEVHYQAIKAVADRYKTAASTVIMDLTVEAEAFGSSIAFPENELPNILGHLLDEPSSIEALEVPEVTAGRVPEYLKASELAVRHIKDRPVLAGCIGPYSLAGRLYGMSEIMVAIYLYPEAIHSLLQKCTDFILKYCAKLKELGVQGVIMAEPAAGLLSNDDCFSYSTVYVRQVVDKLQDGSFGIVLHNCGNKGQCTQAMVDSGAVGLHFGNAIDMLDALKECPTDRLVMGNLNPVGLFQQASAEDVYAATMELLKATEKYRNFVISSGCDIPPSTPVANLEAFLGAMADYNARS